MEHWLACRDCTLPRSRLCLWSGCCFRDRKKNSILFQTFSRHLPKRATAKPSHGAGIVSCWARAQKCLRCGWRVMLQARFWLTFEGDVCLPRLDMPGDSRNASGGRISRRRPECTVAQRVGISRSSVTCSAGYQPTEWQPTGSAASCRR